jgi:SH3-like domain-containing protein
MLSRQQLAALSLGFLAAATAPSLAQTTMPTAAEPATVPAATAPAPAATDVATEAAALERPFVGTVTGSNVNVRFGPADSYYITSQLGRGEQVVVVGSRFDWWKIIPPRGSFSCVAKRLVDREEGASEGTINADNTLVRAGSNLNQLKEPQTKLMRGAKVTITGEVDDFYRIVPPAGAYLYISKRFVTPLRDASADELRAHLTPSAEGGAATATDVPPRAETAPGEPQPSPTGGAVVEEYDRLNASYEAMQKQPIEERGISDLRASYETLVARPDMPEGLRRAARNRVAILKVLEQQQSEIVAARKDAAAFRTKLAETENQRRQIEQRMKNAGVAVFTAVGQFQNSSIQQGDKPLFRLVDPANGQTVVYIATENPQHIGMVGQVVGVRGEVVSDQRLSVKVISPSAVEAVDAQRIARGVTAIYMPASFMKTQAGEVQSGATTAPAEK